MARQARGLAILGTSSWAGKSLITTGLCRWFARRGVRVAPFKAQNMSNNARVTADGEIGAAQYLQALACGIEPDVRMNPVLVKPEAETRSQVVVRGRFDPVLSATDWRLRAPALRPIVEASLRALLRDFELVILEGAGSPAEINLTDIDLTNLHAMAVADATGILVTDISRGGAFAHLFGTWSLLAPRHRERIGGFVLNRFRGDPALLHPAPQDLHRLTGIPTLGVVPELDHAIPDEDGPGQIRAHTGDRRQRVAIVAYPRISNLDEFRVLEQVADVVWARRPADLDDAVLVILPGSKEPLGDLDWLRTTGIAARIQVLAGHGGRILGICGGLQMLGRTIDGREALGVLGFDTRLGYSKIVRHASVDFMPLDEPWTALSNLSVRGCYEIREGRSVAGAGVKAAAARGLAYVDGSVLAVYAHGLLEDARVVEALIGAQPQRSLDEAFDALADALEDHLDMAAVSALAGCGSSISLIPRRAIV